MRTLTGHCATALARLQRHPSPSTSRAGMASDASSFVIGAEFFADGGHTRA
ncbi:hypothetical protein ACFVJM_32395 [Streptomyces virginiae]|uniref:hypothetical protein n=1 Tax=Streptomyces virginiae TaxID=1961 RepID=UPI003626B5E3